MTTTFQSDAAKFGAAYESHVQSWLIGHGCTIKERHHRHASGVEFDLFVVLWDGTEVGIECKASPDSAISPGMVRSDNRWKVLGYLWALRLWRDRTGESVRYMLITSHMPEPGTPQRRLLDLAELVGDLQVLEVPMHDVDHDGLDARMIESIHQPVGDMP